MKIQLSLDKWTAHSLQADTEKITEVMVDEEILLMTDIISIDTMIEENVVITITEDETIEEDVAVEAEREEEEEEEIHHLRNVVDWWH